MTDSNANVDPNANRNPFRDPVHYHNGAGADISAPIPMPAPVQAQTQTALPPTTPTPPQLYQHRQEHQQQQHQQEQQQQQPNADPRISGLRAMFPDYDDLVLQSVFESVGGDQDRALDALLGMSDPEYKPEPAPAHTSTSPRGAGVESEPISQTDLDEQLARRLMLEEQEAHQAAWQAQQEARIRPQRQGYGAQQRPNSYSNAYSHNPGAGGPPPQQGGDTMAEIQQQLGKITETGKKTFGNIFSKVKAKIQEMDQPKYVFRFQIPPTHSLSLLLISSPSRSELIHNPSLRTGQSSSTQASWTGESSSGYEQHAYAYQGASPPQRPYSQQLQPQPQPQAQAAYYDPNASAQTQYNAPPGPPPVQSQTHPYAQRQQPQQRASSPPITLGAPPQQAQAQVQGYDASPEPAAGQGYGYGRSVSPPVGGAPRTPPPPATGSGSGFGIGSTSPGAAAPIDGGKLGLLPKRPVSLMRPSSPPVQHSVSQESDESDELEYVENPFEEHRNVWAGAGTGATGGGGGGSGGGSAAGAVPK
ncbi:hypothetical protein H0H81_001578 [Sphagnurus paluster]|uniref:CUE domain-containing protein n=1 Tax=Sphagnurus paluster TaxID=117069 RepID=A0A9P7FY65_9AGAR|nr:hypothetical protein H0H81_001578 [Sphagnurus paluster]